VAKKFDDPVGPARPIQGQSLLRKYPPLIFLVIVLLIAALVLPSALNLPQSNPTTVLEYAPVPPEDEELPPSAEGNVSSLGLGSSSGLTTGAPPPVPQVDPQQKGGSGQRPVTKRCVGKPLRQTEDPNSPPCVPFFEGDNGGATWQGVTAEEVKIVIYHSAFTSDQNETEGNDTSAGESTPSRKYCDLDRPDNQQPGPFATWDCTDLDSSDLQVVEAARGLSRYFNERFQTYGRRLHFYIYWASGGSASSRRADAAANWEMLKPFAVIDRATFGGFNDVYAEALARRRVSSYGSFGYLPAKDYQKNAPYVWNFWPDVEHWADMYTSYVCTKVAPFRVSHAGDDKQNEKMNGRPRRYAIMSTDDPSYPGLHYFRELVRAGIERCGIANPLDIRFPYAGANIDNRSGAQSGYGVENIAKMQGDKVTTVLWLGGMESKTTLAAERATYFPEWIVAGDRIIDDLLNGRAQAQRVWSHAWVVSSQLREIQFEESPARQAFREVEPGGRPIREYWATTLYKDMFAASKAIQVAGPHLSPQTVDQGHHAIPRTSSRDPRVAACFYDPGDYSCVKDAHEAWWDSTAPDPNRESGAVGCWRMVQGGKRYLAGTWEGGDIIFNPNDTCNGIKGASHNYATP